MLLNKEKTSFYTVLALIVVLIVSSIMTLHAIYLFQTKQNTIINKMKADATLSLNILKENLVKPMEAYAVYEYEKLVLTEITLRGHFAIIVEDYNMGKMIGQKEFLTGYIQNDKAEIVYLSNEGQAYIKKLDDCFYTAGTLIKTSSQEVIGKIRIYISDEAMQKELSTLINTSIINAVIISLFLIISLIGAINYFVLKPLSDVVRVLEDRDKDGLPKEEIPEGRYKEITPLSKTLNTMLQTIKQSKKETEEEHKKFQKSSMLNKLILKTIPDLIWLKTANGKFMMCNPSFEKFYGVPEKEIIGKTDYDFVSKEQAEFFRKHDQLAIEARDALSNEEWLEYPDGKKVLVHTTKTPLILDDGTIIGTMGISHDITHYKEVIKELEYSAKHDSLTSIPNRYLFNELMFFAMNNCLRKKCKMALLYIDLDQFKEINDTYGHEAGDAVIKETAKRLKSLFRSNDIVARLGGDEFVVGVFEYGKEEDIIIILEKVLQEIQKPIKYEDKNLKVTLSIGVSFYPQKTDISLQELLKQADFAMYQAKNSGKNRYIFSY
jgi:diguanylate cyclase (GGDEF)-like protein/PAS domain S-box-containing protein